MKYEDDQKLIDQIAKEEKRSRYPEQFRKQMRVLFINDQLEEFLGSGPLADAACRWLRSREGEESLSKRLLYAKDARTFVKKFRNANLSEITSKDLSVYFRSRRPLSKDSRTFTNQVSDLKKVAKGILEECRKEGHVTSNAAVHARMKKFKKPKLRRSEYLHMFSNTDLGKAIVQCLDDMFPEVSLSTFENYVSKMKTIDRYFKNTELSEIRFRDLRQFVRDQQKKRSNKTINEYLILIRKIFQHAMEEELIEKNPALNLKNLKITYSEPDPFTTEEVRALVAHSDGFESEIALFLVGVYTGMRISELLALAWEDINLEKRRIHVKRANVKGYYKTPKTRGSNRVIEISSQCVDELSKLKKTTGSLDPVKYDVTREDNATVTKQNIRIVFLNTRTGNAIRNDSHLSKYFWAPLLEKSGIRRRGINHCRHTFASQMLSIGQPKGWICNQLGHTSTAMLDAHYGVWMVDESPDFIQKASEHFEKFTKDLPEEELEDET